MAGFYNEYARGVKCSCLTRIAFENRIITLESLGMIINNSVVVSLGATAFDGIDVNTLGLPDFQLPVLCNPPCTLVLRDR